MLKFKGYCTEHQIKQKDIAELLNISVQSVNRKINGKEPFTLDQVKTICTHYGISADEYFV
jgi:transcriptional regulator with XRE-family HTH domain